MGQELNSQETLVHEPQIRLPKKFLLKMRKSLGDTKIVVHILVCLFAVASWIDLNGMWVELPLLVMVAPEQWTLPSYMTIISQVANIGPIIFVLVGHFAPGTKPRLEVVTSLAIIVLSLVSCLLMAFLWDVQATVGGRSHSLALLLLNFFLALGDCTSSLSFYAFMSHMKPQYMPSLFLGEGLSGMIPAMVALGQGAGHINCINVTTAHNLTMNSSLLSSSNATSWHLEPRYSSAHFSVKAYFFILSAVIAVSAISFLLLNKWKYCRSEFVDELSGLTYEIQKARTDSDYGSVESSGVRNIGFQVVGSNDDNNFQLEKAAESESSVSRDVASEREPTIQELSSPTFWTHQAVLVLINMTFTTFLSTIQVYSTLPYGLSVYHLATTLVQIANPVACLLSLFFLVKHQLAILLITGLGQLCVTYIIYLAALSPRPPLMDSNGGGTLTLTVWILATLFLIYAKVCVSSVLRKSGRLALICAGVATQVGSLIGAMVGFILVNEFDVFKQADYC